MILAGLTIVAGIFGKWVFLAVGIALTLMGVAWLIVSLQHEGHQRDPEGESGDDMTKPKKKGGRTTPKKETNAGVKAKKVVQGDNTTNIGKQINYANPLGPIMRGNVSLGNKGDGYYFGRGVRPSVFDDNLAFGNGRDGVHFEGDVPGEATPDEPDSSGRGGRGGGPGGGEGGEGNPLGGGGGGGGAGSEKEGGKGGRGGLGAGGGGGGHGEEKGGDGGEGGPGFVTIVAYDKDGNVIPPETRDLLTRPAFCTAISGPSALP